MPQNRTCGRDAGHDAAPWALLHRATLGAALTAIVVCTGTAAARAGNDTMGGNSSIYDEFLQVVGISSSGDNIDYSERSPLVIPPNKDLPPPAANVPPPSADWPNDPDIARRAQAKKKKEVIGPHPDYASQLDLPLRPDELRVPGRNTSVQAPGAPGGLSGADYPEAAVSHNKGLFSSNPFKKQEYATFTGEPARTRLTEPPPGYLTPSPDQPYGIGPANKEYKIPTVADRAEPAR